MKGGHKAAFRRSLEDLTVLMDHEDAGGPDSAARFYRYSAWLFLISSITKEERMLPMESMVPRTLMMNSL